VVTLLLAHQTYLIVAEENLGAGAAKPLSRWHDKNNNSAAWCIKYTILSFEWRLCEKLHLFMCNDGVAATRTTLMSRRPVAVPRRLKSVAGRLKLVAGRQRHCVKSFIDSNANILSRKASLIPMQTYCRATAVAMNFPPVWKEPNYYTSAVEGGDAHDAAASPTNFSWAKLVRFGQIWSDLGKLIGFGQIWLDLGKIKILHPPKTFNLLRLWTIQLDKFRAGRLRIYCA